MVKLFVVFSAVGVVEVIVFAVGVGVFNVGVVVGVMNLPLSLVSSWVVSNLSCTCGETVLATVFSAAPTTLVTVASVSSLRVPVRWRRLLTLLVLVALDSMDLVWLFVKASISRLCMWVSRLLMNCCGLNLLIMIPRTMLHRVLLPRLTIVLTVLLTNVLGAKLSRVMVVLRATMFLMELITSRLNMDRALCTELLLVCTVSPSMLGLGPTSLPL